MIALILGQLLLGWLIADIVTGLFHWWEDRVASTATPLVGRYLIVPNRAHHRDPQAITQHGLSQRSRDTALFALAIGIAWWLLLGSSIVLAAACVGGIVSTEVHYAAHKPLVLPRWIRVLQEVGLLQSPAHHAGHHRPGSSRRYCILTDWLNPPLDALAVWARLERLLARLGIPPSLGAR